LFGGGILHKLLGIKPGGKMIREIEVKDTNDMIVLLGQLNPHQINFTDGMTDDIQEKIGEIQKYNHLKIFCYEHEGKAVGTCTVGRIEGLSHGCRPFAVIENVAVLDNMRLKGIGKALVCCAMNQAEAWNCYKVILETGSKREETLKFYEKCGLVRGDKTAFIKRFE
jgi:GNAT superfamily N-acetyltransferase